MHSRAGDDLISVYTWFVLMQLDQHRKDVADCRSMKIRELAFYSGHEGPDDRRRAAEALALPLMNLYSALGKTALERGVSMDQAKQMIVGVLLDGEKTVTDLAAALDECYQLPQARTLA